MHWNEKWYSESTRVRPSLKSAIPVIVANAIALVFCIIGEWNAFDVMFLYWAESAIIGIYNVVRILLARGTLQHSKFFVAPFFMVHYGIFMFVHLVFIAVFAGMMGTGNKFTSPEKMVLQFFSNTYTLISIGAMLVSHGFELYDRYIKPREYENTSVMEQMFRPYGRIVLMHLSIIFGAFLVFIIPFFPVFLLIAGKTFVDLKLSTWPGKKGQQPEIT